MRIRLSALLALTLLAACKAPATPTDVKATRATASPTARPTAKPSQAPARLLQPLPGTPTVLAGNVRLDANHVVAAGGSNVISNDGASIISNDGASLAADGNLITNDGGSLIPAEGNTLLTNDGGTLITNDGGSIISNDGASVVSNDGNSINGQGIISNDGASYRLAATRSLPAGTELPVVGAQVAVRSLDTGKLLPVGQDPDGKPVYTVYTNATGGYKVYLATETSQNVRVETALPAASGAVQRYAALAEVDGKTHDVDEDRILATSFLEEGYANRMLTLMTASEATLTAGGLGALLGPLGPFRAAVAPIANDRVKVEKLINRIADYLIRNPRVTGFDINTSSPDFQTPKGKAMIALNDQRGVHGVLAVTADVLADARRATAARMQDVAAHPERYGGATPAGYFDTLGPVQAYRQIPLDHSFHVRYPTDFCRFLVHAYLSQTLLTDQGVLVEDGYRFNAMARLLEGEVPTPPLELAKYPGLLVAKPSPDAAPRLCVLYQGEGALAPDVALPQGEVLRLSAATKGVADALITVAVSDGGFLERLQAEVAKL